MRRKVAKNVLYIPMYFRDEDIINITFNVQSTLELRYLHKRLTVK